MYKFIRLIFSIILIFHIVSCEKQVESWRLNIEGGVYKENGQLYTGKVLDLKKKTGQVKKSFYCKKGKLEGEYLVYYPNGKLKLKEKYSDGKLNGQRRLHNNDVNNTLIQVETYKNDVLNGYCYFDNNHGGIKKGFYKEGKQNGFWIWLENNKVVAKGRYLNGNGTVPGKTDIPSNGRVGFWYFYEEDGLVISKHFKNTYWFLAKKFNLKNQLIGIAKANLQTDEYHYIYLK